MVGNAVVDLNCNVQVKVIDRHGKVVRTSQKHNKATINLVDGILRFLKGDFSNTEYNNGDNTPDEAEIYLPVRAEFGRIGVKMKESPTLTDRRFDYVDYDEMVQPTFDSIALQEPVNFSDYTLLKFKRISQVGYTDNNNAECLEFSLYINPGKLVGYNKDTSEGKEFVPYDWSYYNPEKEEFETMLTEVGLFSSSNILLARVLFDGEVRSETYSDGTTYPSFVDINDDDNPIVQSQSTTVVLVWRIGIVSVGKNDEFVTQSNLSTQQFSRQLSEYLLTYISEVTGTTSDQWKEGYTPTIVRSDIQDKVQELLNGNSTHDLVNKELI